MSTAMFIRKSRKRTKGKEYYQYHLIESVRTQLGPRHNFILNLGTLTVSDAKLKLLANAIESKLNNQPVLDLNIESDPEIEGLAEHFTQIIIRNRMSSHEEEKVLKEDQPENSKPLFETIDLTSTTTSDGRTIGSEYVIHDQIEKYRLSECLANLGFDEKSIKIAQMLIIGRAVHPASERETVRWIKEGSALQELLGSNFHIYDNALHRTASLLWEHKDVIEEYLTNKSRKLFSLKETVILYDLTNTFFEGSKKNSVIAKHSKASKEKRTDCPLITLALTVDEEGFPKKSKIYEGNIAESKTLKHILDELSNDCNLLTQSKTVVIDAGIATEANLQLIKKYQFNYVAVSLKRSFPDSFWKDCQESEIELKDKKTKLTIKSARNEAEVFLKCHSTAKEIKESAIINRKVERFSSELEKIKSGLQKKGARNKLTQVSERVGRLKEKYKVGNQFDITYSHKQERVYDIVYVKNKQNLIKTDLIGDYVLRTNRLDLEDQQITKIHRILTTVEASFRSMKSELGIRPNFHKKDSACCAHIFITVLAYYVIAGINKRLKSAKVFHHWNTIRNILSTHQRVTTTFNNDNGKVFHIRTSNIPNMSQKSVYSALKLRYTPLKQIIIQN